MEVYERPRGTTVNDRDLRQTSQARLARDRLGFRSGLKRLDLSWWPDLRFIFGFGSGESEE